VILRSVNRISRALSDEKLGTLMTSVNVFACLYLDANVSRAWDGKLMRLGWLIGGIRG
jgi:hypothetical protein